MRILIDSNVLLRSVEAGHVHYQSSVEAIDILRRMGHELTIVPQNLYEFWSVATRPLENNGLGMSPAESLAEITSIRKPISIATRRARSIFYLGKARFIPRGQGEASSRCPSRRRNAASRCDAFADFQYLGLHKILHHHSRFANRRGLRCDHNFELGHQCSRGSTRGRQICRTSLNRN